MKEMENTSKRRRVLYNFNTVPISFNLTVSTVKYRMKIDISHKTSRIQATLCTPSRTRQRPLPPEQGGGCNPLSKVEQ